MATYKVYAEDVIDKTRRYLGEAVGDNIGKGLFALYADECSDMEEVVIVPVGLSAAEMGRKGGSAKSDRKTASSRENGKKGGRPSKAVAETYRGQCDKCGLVGDWKQYEDGTYQKKCEHCGSTRGWTKVR